MISGNAADHSTLHCMGLFFNLGDKCMASEFSTFVMSETTVKQIKALPEELRLKFYDAVTDYGIYGIEPEFTGLESIIWIGIKDLITHSKRKDEKWLQKQRENGQKGGRPRAQVNPSEPTENAKTQNNPNNPSLSDETQNNLGYSENPPKTAKPTENAETLNDNDNDNDNYNSGLNENSKILQKEFLKYWQNSPDIFDPMARIENYELWENYWNTTTLSCQQISKAMNNYLLEVKEGIIKRQYIPNLPDRFVLGGWLTKCQERLNPDNNSNEENELEKKFGKRLVTEDVNV